MGITGMTIRTGQALILAISAPQRGRETVSEMVWRCVAVHTDHAFLGMDVAVGFFGVFIGHWSEIQTTFEQLAATSVQVTTQTG